MLAIKPTFMKKYTPAKGQEEVFFCLNVLLFFSPSDDVYLASFLFYRFCVDGR